MQEETDVALEAGETLSTSKAGGHRTSKSYRMDLIPYEALKRLGNTMDYGEFKYGRHAINPLLANWKGLDISTDQSPINHAIAHLSKYAAGDETEDHLGHALANIAFMCWFVDSEDSPWYGMTYPEILSMKPGPQGKAVDGFEEKILETLTGCGGCPEDSEY